ncbi:phage protein [Staphylococcus schweitzeri]|uniref:Phage protein n=2 Tax=Staphylococcus schweitzeri TaxID=1654388 RepID=A0A077UHB5_9STAP|nr:phage protein [Staphylococcus schweitzeri]
MTTRTMTTMKNDANEKMFVLYQQLFDEFKKTNENCLLEIEQTPTSQIIINFLHYHDSYKTNNKLLQILEVYPESHERMKNYNISVMRGQILVKKGV